MAADSQLIKRLRLIVKSCGGQSKFAKACGVSQPLVSLMLKGEREVNFTVITGVCHELGYSPEWVILGTGDKLTDGSKKEATKLVTDIQLLRTEVQLLHARMKHYENMVQALISQIGIVQE